MSMMAWLPFRIWVLTAPQISAPLLFRHINVYGFWPSDITSEKHLKKIKQIRMIIITAASTTNVESLLCDRHHAKPFMIIT